MKISTYLTTLLGATASAQSVDVVVVTTSINTAICFSSQASELGSLSLSQPFPSSESTTDGGGSVTATAGSSGGNLSSPTLSSSSAATSSSVPPAFIITSSGFTQDPNRVQRLRRQNSGEYLDEDGQPVNECGEAEIFSLGSDGRLSDRNGLFYSTSPGQASQLLIASAENQGIDREWNVTGNELKWYDVTFTGGAATFCRDADRRINAYFTVTPPSSCAPVRLTIEAITSCPALASLGSGTVGPSPPTSTPDSITSEGQASTTSDGGVLDPPSSSFPDPTVTSDSPIDTNLPSPSGSEIVSESSTPTPSDDGGISSSIIEEVSSSSSPESEPSPTSTDVLPSSSIDGTASVTDLSTSETVATSDLVASTTASEIVTESSSSIPVDASSSSDTAGSSSSDSVPSSTSDVVDSTPISSADPTSSVSSPTSSINTSSSTRVESSSTSAISSSRSTNIGSSSQSSSSSTGSSSFSSTVTSTTTSTITSSTSSSSSRTTSSSSSSSTTSSSSGLPTVGGLAYYAMPDVGRKTVDNSTYDTPTNVTSYVNNATYITKSGYLSNLNFESDLVSYNYTFPGDTVPTRIAPYAIVFQGYFIAPQAGRYTFNSTIDTDDFGFIWVGPVAYKLWTRENVGNGQSIKGTKDANVTVGPYTLGQKVPINVLWVNRGQIGKLIFNILSIASGTVYTDTTGLFVATPCDPQFFYAVAGACV